VSVRLFGSGAVVFAGFYSRAQYEAGKNLEISGQVFLKIAAYQGLNIAAILAPVLRPFRDGVRQQRFKLPVHGQERADFLVPEFAEPLTVHGALSA
jgi:hypothetical protein